jgi:hypothetical protein
MIIEIPNTLIENLQKAYEGYDVPETKEEIQQAIIDIIERDLENF